ncbi:MAG: hypothetical protein LPK49_08750, partial [Bacteroidota bacterium]|nr:hypothetical protein [Bacteroidota bacterium]
MKAPLSLSERAILNTLGYFDYFRYPLTAEEIHRFLEIELTQEELKNTLFKMMEDQLISSDETFFSLYGKLPLFERRKTSNALALSLLPRARKVGQFLYQFPFVRFVGISGSLSKLYADEHTDFDFFIITAPNRLWIARSLMHAFKKMSFLVGKQHHFCMNYYLDAEHLRIEDENRYTAIELSTLIPVANPALLEQLILENTWLKELVPNFRISPIQNDKSDRQGTLKRISEWLLNGCIPNAMNRFLMQLTDFKWKRKWKKAGFPEEDYALAFRTREYVSKNHPKNYQKRVLKET